MVLSDGYLSLSKWQIALLVGVPVVGGVCYYYWRPRQPVVTSQVDLKLQGNQWFKQKEYKKAIECYTKAIKNGDPGLAALYQNRAAAYEALDNTEQVINDTTQAILLDNKYSKALLRRARALEKCDRLQEALSDLTAVCLLTDFAVEAHLLATDRVLRRLSAVKAEEYFSRREKSLPGQQAIKHYFSSFSRHPFVSCLSASELVAMDTDFWKGTRAVLEGDQQMAEQCLTRVIEDLNEPKQVRVNALIKLASLKQSLDLFDRAIALDKENPDIYIHRAQVLIMNESVTEALSDLDLCVKLAPDFASAAAQRLYVRFRLTGQLEGFEEAIESSEVHSLYAQALMESGKLTEAEEHFKKAIKAEPSDGNLLVHHAILCLQKEDKESALKLLEEAVEVDSRCQFALEMLGTLSVQDGCLSRGVHYFESALKLANSLLDCTHLISLKEAATAQLEAARTLGIPVQ